MVILYNLTGHIYFILLYFTLHKRGAVVTRSSRSLKDRVWIPSAAKYCLCSVDIWTCIWWTTSRMYVVYLYNINTVYREPHFKIGIVVLSAQHFNIMVLLLNLVFFYWQTLYIHVYTIHCAPCTMCTIRYQQIPST